MTRVRIFIESRLGCFWVDGSMTKPSRTAQFGKTEYFIKRCKKMQRAAGCSFSRLENYLSMSTMLFALQ